MRVSIFIIISIMGLTNIAGVVNANSVGSEEDLHVCVFSTSSINELFEKKGFGKAFWTYTSPITISLARQRSMLVLQSSEHDMIYVISPSGDIIKIPKQKPGLYFLHSDCAPFVVFYGDGTTEIEGNTVIHRESDEFSVLVDASEKYYARLFRSAVSVGDRFTVFEAGSLKEQFTGSGYALYLESTVDTNLIAVITYAASGAGFRFSNYMKSDAWHLVRQEEVPAPVTLRRGWNFAFSDFDSASSQLVFLEYNVPGSLFGKSKIWLYDLKKQKYIFEGKIPKTLGNYYAFIMPRNFADASYMIWTKKIEAKE